MLRKAAIINAIGKYTGIMLSILVSAILARILSPEDYGTVAVISVFAAFFSTISSMGFGAAIIQKKELTKNDTDHIFSFTVYIALFVAIIFAGTSFFIADFYDDPVYVPLGQLLSISLFFNAIDMVPSGILNREKRFLIIAVRSVVVYLISSIVSIVMAFHGYKYYALVAQTILAAILGFLWDQFLTRSQFWIKVDLSSVRKVFSYSGYQFAFNLVNYLSRNLDNLLTGKFIGKVELGYYNKAYSLMLYPVSNLAGVVTPVLHPVLSDYQDNQSIIYHKYIQVVRMFACIGLLVAPICYLASEEIILIVFGNQWSVSGLCFKFLAMAILPQMINSGAGAIFQSLGNTKLLFFNCCINTVITVIAICFGIFVGKDVVFLSVCVAIAYICHFLTAFYMLIKFGFGYRCHDAIMELKNEGLMLLIMLICIMAFPFNFTSTMMSMIIKAVWVACFYCAGLIITKNYRLLASILVRK